MIARQSFRLVQPLKHVSYYSQQAQLVLENRNPYRLSRTVALIIVSPADYTSL